MAGIQDVFAADRASRQQQAQYGAEMQGLKGLSPQLEAALSAQQGIYGSPNGYQGMVSQYANMGNDPYFKQTQQPYQFKTDVNEYLNPQIGFQIQQANRGLDASAAAKGGLYSSGHGMAIQAQGQGIANQGYQQAFQNMQDVNKMGYGQYSDLMNNLLQKQQLRANVLGQGAQIGMQGLQGLSSARGNYDTSKMNQGLMMANVQGKQAAANITPGVGEYLSAGLGGLMSAGTQLGSAYLMGG